MNWDICFISQYDSLYWSTFIFFNWSNWLCNNKSSRCSINWNIFDSFNMNWFNCLIVNWNVVFIVHSDDRRNVWISNILWLFFMSESWSENFWNNWKRNVSFTFDFNCVNITFIFRYNWFFNFQWFWSWMNWNITNSFNSKRFNFFILGGYVMISINLDNWYRWFFSLDNSVMEYWSVNFWDNSDWNVSSLSNIKCFYWFTICGFNWIRNIMSWISFMNWYINITF